MLITELEHLEKKYYGFSDILAENIERREKYSKVFLIPSALQSSPSAKGLRDALSDLTIPLLSSYCMEDKKFLENLGSTISLKTRRALFQRTIKNCDLLINFCGEKAPETLHELKQWAEAQVAKMTE
jgi:hypothetical protein